MSDGQGSCEKHGTTWAVVDGCAGCPICTEERAGLCVKFCEIASDQELRDNSLEELCDQNVLLGGELSTTDRPAADFITELKRLLGKDRTTIAKYKALICKLVEAGERAEKLVGLHVNLRAATKRWENAVLDYDAKHFGDICDSLSDEIKQIKATLSTVIKEAKGVME